MLSIDHRIVFSWAYFIQRIENYMQFNKQFLFFPRFILCSIFYLDRFYLFHMLYFLFFTSFTAPGPLNTILFNLAHAHHFQKNNSIFNLIILFFFCFRTKNQFNRFFSPILIGSTLFANFPSLFLLLSIIIPNGHHHEN